MEDHELIVVIVERGKAGAVVREAVKAGAGGATVVYGRGAGEHVLSFFKQLRIEPAKEMILILVRSAIRAEVFAAVGTAARVEVTGQGVAFVLPVLALAGIGLPPDQDPTLSSIP